MALRKCGFRVDQNVAELPGRPDLVLPKSKIVIFVHGCFWHGCPRHFRCPKNNRNWWQSKIQSNRRRDRRKAMALRSIGYSVVTVWEHEDVQVAVRRIRAIRRRRNGER